ncbi:MAG: BMP family ABC transporter substrate-binding protein [Synergistaceae bacterium]|nr:BMP family ABC transporter substrate-binding protein [Synergistaceae bacterium]
MKKFALVLVAVMLILSLGSMALAKNLRVAFIAFGDVKTDPFYKESYSGVQAFANSHTGTIVKIFQEKKFSPSLARKLIRQAVKKYDVVIYCEAVDPEITEIARSNSRVKFIFTEYWPIDYKAKNVELPNVYAMRFKDDELGLLAGLAAALSSKTKKVASVHGVVMPSNRRFQEGFAAGVKYANENYNANTKVIELGEFEGVDSSGQSIGGNYIGSFTNTAKAAIIGQALINSGCDVIFISAGGAGDGVIDAAKNSGNVKLIGCDTDQFDAGFDGDKNIILTSVIKLMTPQILSVLNDIESGYFRNGNYLLGASNHAVGYVKGDHCLLDSDVAEKLDSAFDLMKSGELVPLH